MNRSLEKLIRRGCSAWKPPSMLSLSQWTAKFGYLSGESSSVIGKFHAYPYQLEIMDEFTNPRTEQITLMKSARVGGTKILLFAIAYRIDQNPRSMLVIQPTKSVAKRFSKTEITPLLRDTPVLYGKVAQAKSRDSGNTVLQKDFVGGTLYLVGANSSADLRGITVGDVLLDEEDGYPNEAGNEGDPSQLGIRRSDTHPDRKIVRISSPADKLTSKIEPSFLAGDQRFYHVPCPICGAKYPLKFRIVSGEDPGHVMEWPENQPENAFFRCCGCGGVIEEKYKIPMVEDGEWIARKPFRGHASFHIWAAYSFNPNASWGRIAEEFVQSKETPAKLKVFVNTVLGQTWTSQGDAPDWHRLYERREDYPRGVVPAQARLITAAVDVQQDRLEVDIVAWGPGLENWGIDYRVFYGNTDSISSDVWRNLDELLIEDFPQILNSNQHSGRLLRIACLGIDCGFQTQVVTAWVKRQSFPRVMAIKGSDHERQIMGSPTHTEVTLAGKRIKGSVKHYPIGVSLIKSELYGWLRLPAPTEESPSIPIGYSHFSVNVHNEEYFRQLTAERLEVVTSKNGHRRYEWVKDYKRNEALDTRCYNRALAFQLGVDRWKREGIQPQSAKSSIMVKPQLPRDAAPSPRLPRARPAHRGFRPRRLW